MLIFAEMCVNLHPNLNIFELMRQIKTICMLLMTAFVMTSCLKSNNEVTLYSDASITSFSLGTLNRYLHTTSSTGGDSIIKRTMVGKNYKFNIDQIQHLIYNTDSLPVGVDAAHILCNITSKNNSGIFYEDKDDSNILYLYSSTDSIDFTTPRKFVIYSSDGEGGSEYQVSVNVHKEEAGIFIWHQMPTSDELAKLTNVKAYYWAGQIYVTGDIGEITKIYKVDENGVLKEDVETTNYLPEGIKQWIGTTTKEVYALSTENRLMVSRDGGATWQEDLLDNDASLLPVRDIAFVSYPLDYATNTEYAVIVGNRSLEEYPQEKIAMVWRKIVDNDEYTPEGFWVYMERSDNGMFALPRLENLSLVAYDDGILAIGGALLGADTNNSTSYTQIYQSRDGGITWKYNANYQLPEDFNGETKSMAMVVDSQQNLWLFCGTTGQVWRGRLNKLGWEITE